ncbi:MAG: tape measure protein [Bacteroidales bacterium]
MGNTRRITELDKKKRSRQMNVLTYILQVNDRMSSTLTRIGATTGGATTEVRKLKGEVNSLNQVNLSSFFSSISRISAFLGVGMIAGKTLRMGMEQEMRNTSFDVLFGGAANAKKMIDEISTYAAKSPYGKAGLSEATQMMAGFGIAQDRILPNLRMIGDIAMGDVNKFNSVPLAFSQMSSTGRLMGQDLLQMINAGFNPLNQMSKTTGKSISRLKEEMEKGLISTKMVTQAFQDATSEGGLYYGMIDKISNTAAGQWATAMDNMNEKLLNLYADVLQPILLPALKKFNQFLEDPIGSIGRLTDRIVSDFPVITGLVLTATAAFTAFRVGMILSAGVTAIIAGFKAVLVGLDITIFAIRNATNLWTAAQWLLNVALNANPIGVVVSAILALVAVIWVISQAVKDWGDVWTNVVAYSTLSFDRFASGVELKWLQLQDKFLNGIAVIETGWYKLQSLWNKDVAEAGLSRLEQERNARAQQITSAQWMDKALDNKISNMEIFKWNKTYFSDLAAGAKKMIGISAPTLPGTNGTAGTIAGGVTGGSTGTTTGGDTANSIATGGTKTTHITINIGEMGNRIVINTTGAKEGAAQIRDIILDEMTRVLTMAQGQV